MLQTISGRSKKINLLYLAGIFLSTEIITAILSFTDDSGTSRYQLIKDLFIGGSISLIVGSIFIVIFHRLKTAEEAKRRSDEFSATILQGMKDAVSIIDVNTYRISGVNKAFLEGLALRKEEVIGKTCHEITHHISAPCRSGEDICPLERTRATGRESVTEHTHCCKGQEMCVEVSCSPIKDREGFVTQVVHVARNITERKDTEKKLMESSERYRILSHEFRTLLDAIPDRLLLLSRDMKVQWANRTAAEQLRGEASKLTGEHCHELWHSRSVPCDGCHAIRSFQTGEVESSQSRTLDGRFWDSRAFPIKDEYGNVKSVITVARDVTEKIRMEEEAKLIHAKMIHANKMASLGTLVSGVAHEINNPNNLIMFNGQLMSDVWQDAVNALEGPYREKGDFLLGGLLYSEVKEAAPALISGIMESSRRIKNIVDNLKDYSRHDTSNLDKPVDINKVISASVSIIKNEIKKHTENFDCLLDKKIPPANGSPQQLEQVIINLITNALQALPDKKRGIRITTSVNSSHVVIQVKDEGVGMSEEVLDKIGEPFFTTKLNSGGTGLGLSICHSIIRDHRGSLEFASALNKGTIATIRLPLADFSGDA